MDISIHRLTERDFSIKNGSFGILTARMSSVGPNNPFMFDVSYEGDNFKMKLTSDAITQLYELIQQFKGKP